MISNLSAKIWIVVTKHIDYSVMYLKLRNFGPQDLYAPYKYSAKIWQREEEYTPKNREKAVIRKSNHNIRFSGAQNWAKIPNFILYYSFGVTFPKNSSYGIWSRISMISGESQKSWGNTCQRNGSGREEDCRIGSVSCPGFPF